MKTYIFADKNSSITITCSAENEKEAREQITEMAQNPRFVDYLRLDNEVKDD